MSAARLSKVDSSSFRKLLVSKVKRHGWTLNQTSAILGCSRKTAWNHLRPDCRTRVRWSYADMLAKASAPEEVTWTNDERVRAGTAAILEAWGKCSTSAARRKVAYRLAIFICEVSVGIYKIPTTTMMVVSDVNEDPYSVTVTLMIPRTRICGTIIISFDRVRRSKIHAEFCNSAGKNFFKGFLDKDLFPRLFRKLKSWQLLQP